MRIAYVLIAVMFASCGCKNQPKFKIEESAAKYVASFEREFGVRIEFSIELREDSAFDKDKEVGHCYYNFDSHGTRFNQYIKLKRSKWEQFSNPMREQLVYHELGHCVLGLAHNDYQVDYDFGGPSVPGSIMHTSMIEPWAYVKYRDEYIKEMHNVVEGYIYAQQQLHEMGK